jgi:hypothetical protein
MGQMAVIGFTGGTKLFPELWGHTRDQMDQRWRVLTEFPLLLCGIRPLAQPYQDLLEASQGGGWCAILIDRNGIILKFYNAPLSEADVREAAAFSDWKAKANPRPAASSSSDLVKSQTALRWI